MVVGGDDHVSFEPQGLALIAVPPVPTLDDEGGLYVVGWVCGARPGAERLNVELRVSTFDCGSLLGSVWVMN